MKPWLPFVLCSFISLSSLAQEPASAGCAQARDPLRCEARQTALVACADKRGAEKRVCFDALMPPIDCSKAEDPAHCEAIERAKEICKGKNGKQLKACLKAENPKKSRKKASHRHHTRTQTHPRATTQP